MNETNHESLIIKKQASDAFQEFEREFFRRNKENLKCANCGISGNLVNAGRGGNTAQSGVQHIQTHHRPSPEHPNACGQKSRVYKCLVETGNQVLSEIYLKEYETILNLPCPWFRSSTSMEEDAGHKSIKKKKTKKLEKNQTLFSFGTALGPVNKKRRFEGGSEPGDSTSNPLNGEAASSTASTPQTDTITAVATDVVVESIVQTAVERPLDLSNQVDLLKEMVADRDRALETLRQELSAMKEQLLKMEAEVSSSKSSVNNSATVENVENPIDLTRDTPVGTTVILNVGRRDSNVEQIEKGRKETATTSSTGKKGTSSTPIGKKSYATVASDTPTCQEAAKSWKTRLQKLAKKAVAKPRDPLQFEKVHFVVNDNRPFKECKSASETIALIWAMLKELKIRNHVIEVSKVGGSVVELYVKKTRVEAVKVILKRARCQVFLDYNVLAIPDHSKKTADFYQEKVVKRISHLLFRAPLVNLRVCMLDGLPVEIQREIQMKVTAMRRPTEGRDQNSQMEQEPASVEEQSQVVDPQMEGTVQENLTQCE